MRIKMKRFLGILLSFALVMGLLPGMNLTAYAEDDFDLVWNKHEDEPYYDNIQDINVYGLGELNCEDYRVEEAYYKEPVQMYLSGTITDGVLQGGSSVSLLCGSGYYEKVVVSGTMTTPSGDVFHDRNWNGNSFVWTFEPDDDTSGVNVYIPSGYTFEFDTISFDFEKYHATYDGNGATSGTVPVDNNEYRYGSNITVKGNTENLKKSGYVFTGWLADPVDYEEKIYAAGARYGADGNGVNSDVTFYAQWREMTNEEKAAEEAEIIASIEGSGTKTEPFIIDSSEKLEAYARTETLKNSIEGEPTYVEIAADFSLANGITITKDTYFTGNKTVNTKENRATISMGDSSGASITIDGPTFVNDIEYGPITGSPEGDVIVKSGNVGCVVSSGPFTMTDGTVDSLVCTGESTISGGTIGLLMVTSMHESVGNLLITGGTFEGNIVVDDGNLTVKGGKFNKNKIEKNALEGYLATGYNIIENGDYYEVADVSVKYVEYNTEAGSFAEKKCYNYQKVTSSDESCELNGWYVVDDEVTITGRVTLDGDVNLILCDGASLTVTGEIYGNNSSSLTVYGQEDGTGELTVTATENYSSNAIDFTSGTLTVHGGVITTKAIEAGNGIYIKDFVAYGGTISAEGGLGSGILTDSFKVYGGEVTSIAQESPISENPLNDGDMTLSFYGGTSTFICTGDYGYVPSKVLSSSTMGDGMYAYTGDNVGSLTYSASMNQTRYYKCVSVTNMTPEVQTYVGDALDASKLVPGDKILEPGSLYLLPEDGADKYTVSLKSGAYSTDKTSAAQSDLTGFEGERVEVGYDGTNHIYGYMFRVMDGGSIADSDNTYYPWVSDTLGDAWEVVSVDKANHVVTLKGYKEDLPELDKNTEALNYKQWTVDESDDTKAIAETANKAEDTVWKLADGYRKWGAADTDTWYYVDGTVEIDNIVVVNGNVHLILLDGATLNANNKINIYAGSSLNIYAGSTTDTVSGTGKLNVSGQEGIIAQGAVSVHGGIVTSNGDFAGARISNNTLTVFDGAFTATGNNTGANVMNGALTINGGTVSLIGLYSGVNMRNGTVTINDGELTATGSDEQSSYGIQGSNSIVTINSGTVKADGSIAGIDKKVTLTLGEAVAIKGGSSSSDELITLAEGPVDNVDDEKRNPYMETYDLHIHSFTYAQGDTVDTIVATCNNTEGCPLADNDYKASLTIVKPTMTTYGQTGTGISAEAAITDANSIKGDAVIKYYNATKSGETYTRTGDALTAAPTNAGDYVAEITLGEDDNTATAFVGYTIAPKSVTVTGITAENKEYNGNTAATLIFGSAVINGIESGDEVTLSDTATGSFSDKNVGEGKTVTITGLTLTGNDASNYTLASQPTATANITAKSVTVTGITAENKVYDGNTNAVVNCESAVIIGKVENDDLSFNEPSGSFSDKNVGEGKTVSFSGLTLSGSDSANYSLSAQPEDTTADITAKAVTVTGITAENKEYDGDTNATVIIASAVIDGKVENDDLSFNEPSGSFSDKNVGDGKTVTFSGLTLSGSDSANYTLDSQPASVTANITAKPVTVSGIKAEDKTYDGTTDATLDYTEAVIDGKLDTDTLTVTATGAFEDADSGTGKTVNLSGLTLDGTDKDNYVLAATGQQMTSLADITPKSITGATVTLDKTQLTYNGSEQTVNVTDVTIDGMSLTENTDYTVTGNTGIDKNDYTVTVTGLGNFTNTATADWKIVEKAMNVKADNVNVTYDGKDHGIKVEVSDPASGAEVKYGTTEGTYDLEESPTIKDAGTLTVYYKVTAGSNYSDYTGKAVVTVEKLASTAANVTANNREYDGTEKPLVNVTGEAKGGEMQYAIGKDSKTAPVGEWNTDVPTGTKAGTYYVWYKVVGDANHFDSEAKCIESIIKEQPKEEPKDEPKEEPKEQQKDEPKETPKDVDVTPEVEETTEDNSSEEVPTETQSPYRTEWVDGQWYDSEGNATYKPQGKWYQDSTGWWYQDEAGWYPSSQWQKIDGKWYYFTSDGYMDYSEYRDGFWLGSDGAWVETYYGGGWGVKYGQFWYEDATGWYPVSQWLWINGKCYYFGSDGYRVYNQYVDGYWVNNDGEWEP